LVANTVTATGGFLCRDRPEGYERQRPPPGAGFEAVTRTAAARERLRAAVTPTGDTEHVALRAADGRVVATTVEADRPVFDDLAAALDAVTI